MGKKSRRPKKKPAAASAAAASSAAAAPLPVDLSKIDSSVCSRCNAKLKPDNWSQRESLLETCCGSRTCFACFDSMAKKINHAKKMLSESADSDSVDLPQLLQIHNDLRGEPCVVCGSNLDCSDQERLKQVQRLANAGVLAGQCMYAGWLFEGSNGVPLDQKKAMEWYRLAAEKGHALSQVALGDRYMSGDGPEPQDYLEAKKWFELAAVQGNATAQNGLGHIYRDGLGGVPRDRQRAVELFRQSAEQGYPPAIHDYGVCLIEDEREVEALGWFLKGASDESHIDGYRPPIAACQHYCAAVVMRTYKEHPEALKELGILVGRDSSPLPKAVYKEHPEALKELGIPVGDSYPLPTAVFWAERSVKNGYNDTSFCETLRGLVWKRCMHCKKPNPTVRCSSRKAVAYCGKECQKLNWRTGHKEQCRAVPTVKTKRESYSSHECSYCGKADPTFVCGKCEDACYCSNRCQSLHWTAGGHKEECKRK